MEFYITFVANLNISRTTWPTLMFKTAFESLLHTLVKYYFFVCLHGETFFINFYYSIFQFREKRITLRITVSKNTKLHNNDIKLQHSS